MVKPQGSWRPCGVNPGLSTLPAAPGGGGITRRHEPRPDEGSISVDAFQRKRIGVSRALTPRARGGDTEEVDCRRAEMHLRLLAEDELRRPASAWGERRIRVGRVADLLTAIGALDDEVAGQIMADFDLARVSNDHGLLTLG